MMISAFVRALSLWLALWPAMASATQNELVPPTAGIYTGVQFSQKIGDAFRSLASCNKGPTAPANVGGSSVDGLCWIDDSVTPWIKKKYVNGGWAVEGALDPATSGFIGTIGGGLGSIGSGATVDLGSVPQANVTITGSTGISNFGSSAPAGLTKIIRFTGAPVLTPSSSLIVPGGFPLTAAANDRAIVTHLGSGIWEITQFTRASGIPVDVAAVGRLEMSSALATPGLSVPAYGQALSRASYPAYLAKITRAQNGTRTSGNATISGIADTSGFGAGMTVESTGVNAGCIIASLVANSSITLNSSGCVTASGTSTVTVFPYGYGTGGDGTTVGALDCRDVTLAGRDDLGGASAGLLSNTYFGNNPAKLGAFGGAESHTQTLAELVGHTHTGSGTTGSMSTNATHSHTVQGAQSTPNFGSGSFTAATISTQTTSTVNLDHTHSFSFTTASTGSAAPFSVVAPTRTVNCFVRVIP